MEGSLESENRQISFAEGSSTDGVEWSTGLRLSEDGLIAETDGQIGRNFTPNSIRTPPIPADWSWRLPSFVSVRVDVHGKLSPRRRGEHFPEPPTLNAYVRYGIDRVHWSSWFDLEEVDDADTDARRFRARIDLPAVARSEFDRLHREWEATKPEWVEDEHALCVWIAQHHPDYFSREVPRIGYIQVVLEGISRGMNVTAIEVVGGASASGFSGGGGNTTLREPWHCDLTEHAR